jgi:hypothetical protein
VPPTPRLIYLADYGQATLLPLGGPGVPERQGLPIEGTMAGRAFRRVEVVTSASNNSHRLWVPLLDGVERLGVPRWSYRRRPARISTTNCGRSSVSWPG